MSSKQTKKILVRTKTSRNKICLGCVSVCFVEPKTKKNSVCFGVSKLYRNNWNKQNCFETTLNYLKIPTFALYQTVLVGLLFVSVQSKHINVLKQTKTTLNFWKKYQNMLSIKLFRLLFCLFPFSRTQTTETNDLLRIVPQLVSVVSNRNSFRRTP